MTALVHKLGLSPTLSFHDVYSIEPDLLGFVPRPALALLLVFPVTKKYEEAKRAEDADKPEYNGSGDEEPIIWFKQTIKNACGMFGLLHGVCNGAARSLIGITIADLSLKREPGTNGLMQVLILSWTNYLQTLSHSNLLIERSWLNQVILLNRLTNLQLSKALRRFQMRKQMLTFITSVSSNPQKIIIFTS